MKLNIVNTPHLIYDIDITYSMYSNMNSMVEYFNILNIYKR